LCGCWKREQDERGGMGEEIMGFLGLGKGDFNYD